MATAFTVKQQSFDDTTGAPRRPQDHPPAEADGGEWSDLHRDDTQQVQASTSKWGNTKHILRTVRAMNKQRRSTAPGVPALEQTNNSVVEISGKVHGENDEDEEPGDAYSTMHVNDLRWFDYLYLLFEGFPAHLYRKKTATWITISDWLSHFMFAVVIVTCISFSLETLPEFYEKDLLPFTVIEAVCIGIFTIDLLIRAIFTREHIAFWKSIQNWIDLISILPFYIYLFIPEEAEDEGAASSGLVMLRLLRLMRVFRILKLSKHSVGIQAVVESMLLSSEAISLLIFLLMIATILFSSALFYAEQTGQTFDETRRVWIRDEDGTVSPFQSIFHTMWWCIVTMTTVGYGVEVPVTPLGKTVASITMLCGVFVLAFPTVILSTNFQEVHQAKTEESQRRRLELDDAKTHDDEDFEDRDDLDDDEDGEDDAMGDEEMTERTGGEDPDGSASPGMSSLGGKAQNLTVLAQQIRSQAHKLATFNYTFNPYGEKRRAGTDAGGGGSRMNASATAMGASIHIPTQSSTQQQQQNDLQTPPAQDLTASTLLTAPGASPGPGGVRRRKSGTGTPTTQPVPAVSPSTPLADNPLVGPSAAEREDSGAFSREHSLALGDRGESTGAVDNDSFASPVLIVPPDSATAKPATSQQSNAAVAKGDKEVTTMNRTVEAAVTIINEEFAVFDPCLYFEANDRNHIVARVQAMGSMTDRQVVTLFLVLESEDCRFAVEEACLKVRPEGLYTVVPRPIQRLKLGLDCSHPLLRSVQLLTNTFEKPGGTLPVSFIVPNNSVVSVLVNNLNQVNVTVDVTYDESIFVEEQMLRYGGVLLSGDPFDDEDEVQMFISDKINQQDAGGDDFDDCDPFAATIGGGSGNGKMETEHQFNDSNSPTFRAAKNNNAAKDDDEDADGDDEGATKDTDDQHQFEQPNEQPTAEGPFSTAGPMEESILSQPTTAYGSNVFSPNSSKPSSLRKKSQKGSGKRGSQSGAGGGSSRKGTGNNLQSEEQQQPPRESPSMRKITFDEKGAAAAFDN